MAIFQPVYVIPDARSGMGLGVVDATEDMTVSWRITGSSALTQFQIVIYTNDSASSILFNTGALTDGCPAYGTTSAGEIQFFSYTISAADLASAGITNGNEYKLVITQWWSASESVTQASASAFITRSAPSLSINSIGTAGVIDTRFYAFSASYTQAQGDVLNWFRWVISPADNISDPVWDSGKISGTMDISCYYDGFFSGAAYVVRLTAQTESGVEVDTGWVNFSCEYATPTLTQDVTVSCVAGTDAVLVDWSGIGYIIGVASGQYKISDDYVLTLSANGTIRWDQVGGTPMAFGSPWSVVWKGKISNYNIPIFTIGQETGDIILSYDFENGILELSKGGTQIASKSGIINEPYLLVCLTNTALSVYCTYKTGGLYPSDTLYPESTVYPQADTVDNEQSFTLSVNYLQDQIGFVEIGGYQVCDYLEVIDGTASAETISSVISGDYTPNGSESDYLLANWQNGLEAGTLNVGGDTISGFALYRRKGNETELTKVSETASNITSVYDYSATSQQGPYSYYLFLIGSETYIAAPLVSAEISPCWWNWTLMECAETEQKTIFQVLSAFRFRYNIESGAMSNNNSPSLLQNFTQYPTIQLSPQNYKSASLSGLIGVIKYNNGQPEYIDTTGLRDAIFALSVSKNPLFLKNRKGDLFRVKISGAISMATADTTPEQTQTMTLPWVEVGNANGVGLYSDADAAVSV